MRVEILDDRACLLGEGALWHPRRRQLFWLDILSRKLMSHDGRKPLEWEMPETVSAMGWIDRDRLFLAGETAFWVFGIGTGVATKHMPLEADNPATRSNDGRADPFGGFWIGRMGWQAEPGLGSIWRYYRGALTRLFEGLAVPNAICFSPDGRTAYFADTPTRRIQSVGLDDDGNPVSGPETFAIVAADDGFPDGAVVDSGGCLWIAMWGAGQLLCLDPGGTPVQRRPVPAIQPTCPAFSGDRLDGLAFTSATAGLASPGNADGKTHLLGAIGPYGLPEPGIIL